MSNTTNVDKKSVSTVTTTSKATDKTATDADLGLDQVQETIDAENEQGFRGVETDSTPNENYSLQGVGKGLPTPETDAAQATKVRQETGGAITNIERNAEQNKADK